MIRVLLFDATGTLFHLPRGVGWHYAEVAARLGCRLDVETLNRAFRQAWGEMPQRDALHRARADDDKGWWFTLVQRVLDHGAISAPQLDRALYFETLYAEFTLPGVWELYPEVRAALSALRPHFRLGVISNFDGRLRAILTHLGLEGWFDPIVISSEVGADKPDPWIFQHGLELAGTSAAEALHVGDDPQRDWHGAEAAGLPTFHLDRPHNSLRDLVTLLIPRT